MATETIIQQVGETPEIEAYRIGLLESAKELADQGIDLPEQMVAELTGLQKAAAAQDVFAKNIDNLRAKASILASERAGSTIGLLLMDQERQGANYREKIRQSVDSMERQYLFNIKATEAEYKGIRNRYRSNTINAYNQIPSLGSILLNAAGSGLSAGIQTGAIG